MSYSLDPIGIVSSCFTEKFGVPRQPGLIREARATLELLPPYNRPEALRGLEEFSHLWVIYLFHRCLDQGWRPTVRPPRLGGNRRVGVFATRSNFRPNPLGLSVVELAAVDAARCRLELRGADLLDGTPVLDIKPYLPYADAIPAARGGFAPQAPQASLPVLFSDAAAAACAVLERGGYPELRRLIEQMLAGDPRPAYRRGEEAFGMRVWDLEVKWRVAGEGVVVEAVSVA